MKRVIYIVFILLLVHQSLHAQYKGGLGGGYASAEFPETTSLVQIETAVVSIYPNPLDRSQTLNIESDLVIEQANLLNQQGVLVVSFLNAYKDISLTDYPAGIYWLRIYLRNGSILFKKLVLI